MAVKTFEGGVSNCNFSQTVGEAGVALLAYNESGTSANFWSRGGASDVPLIKKILTTVAGSITSGWNPIVIKYDDAKLWPPFGFEIIDVSGP